MTVPQTVLTLVENFDRNLDAYRNGKYNETQVRLDFINPFFKALGWDMDNSAGYAEAYRDVIHEDAIKVGISTKAPDYSFRVGGQRKFFLEAKKPSVNVKDDVEPAFQLRRYAWSAKLPLSIVTDFEEFAIYDCRQKPDKSDKASKARLFYCTFRDYAEKWDEIAAIFSKDAVLKGSFDKYAVSTKGKRGTSEVDSAFLQEIENWRNLLAHNIALRNDSLSQRELNFAVQQTIDRIIFLRICEDRGIEPYGKLMALQNGADVYARLREQFRDADDRYNSGLFHFKREKARAEAPDELTLNLEIDDKPLKEIFKNLYYPDCPYEFSVLGADILGSVYEQFLGKVIRLTAGNRAVLVQEITGGSDKRIVATYCEDELYYSRDVIPIKPIDNIAPLYLLGIINSWLITWYHQKRNPKSQKGLFPKVLVSDLKNLPIVFDHHAHDKLVALVEKMLALHQQLAAAKTPQDTTQLQRQIAATDKQIDQLVYALYGLTDEEIALVEKT